VLSVKENVTAYDVFKLMDVKHRTAVAVTDMEGNLLACTSGADLKLFAANPRASSLKLPIMDFLSDVRSTQIDIKSPTIVAGLDSTLEHCIGKIAATHVHRLFITDGNHHALRVLSITDLMRWILS
jgi:CBS domain-containing protein